MKFTNVHCRGNWERVRGCSLKNSYGYICAAHGVVVLGVSIMLNLLSLIVFYALPLADSDLATERECQLTTDKAREKD